MITGCPTPQKGIVTYSLSANRQRPMAGALHAAIFNTWRRFRHQVLYVAPPFIVAYAAMNWAIERYGREYHSFQLEEHGHLRNLMDLNADVCFFFFFSFAGTST